MLLRLLLITLAPPVIFNMLLAGQKLSIRQQPLVSFSCYSPMLNWFESVGLAWMITGVGCFEDRTCVSGSYHSCLAFLTLVEWDKG